jgi:hypothetical protein
LTLQIVNVLAVGFQVVKVSSDNLNVQIVGFFLFSFYRAFLFGVSFSFLLTLVGGDVVGKAAGVMFGFGGAVNLCLIPMTNVAIENGDGDFFGANMGFLCLSFPCICFICGLGRFMIFEAATKEAQNGSTDLLSTEHEDDTGRDEEKKPSNSENKESQVSEDTEHA